MCSEDIVRQLLLKCVIFFNNDGQKLLFVHFMLQYSQVIVKCVYFMQEIDCVDMLENLGYCSQ